ncbi:hypothetical protein, partial [Faecalibaculum rodentium]|uniref:hypothetical protein n=1 Tax=Faecalibaculum rodentium TaxID=1702221 RepID=UPI002570F759
MTPVTFSRMPMPAEPAGLQSGERCGKFPALHEAPAEREPLTEKKGPRPGSCVVVAGVRGF